MFVTLPLLTYHRDFYVSRTLSDGLILHYEVFTLDLLTSFGRMAGLSLSIIGFTVESRAINCMILLIHGKLQHRTPF